VVALLGLVVAGASAGPAFAQPEVPVLAGRVNDYAHMLSSEADAALESKLAAIEAETGAQVVILTVTSLEDDPIEDFSIRVAETWEIGREQEDNGVILLVARDERQMRLEVGYGLEGTLTDLQSKRIIADTIAPYFRRDDIAGGLNAGVDAIAGAIRGDPTALVTTPPPEEDDVPGSLIILLVCGALALFTPGIFGWMLYFVTAPLLFFVGSGLGLPFALILTAAWLLLAPLVRLFLAQVLARLPSGGVGGGPGPVIWSGHPGSGGWRSNDWGGGGGFSGGGGSFGGGGASGGW
jgi:uncharacterized protein